MDNKYKSVLADEMYAYIKAIVASNRRTESYKIAFKSLDSFLFERKVSEKTLNETNVMAWINMLSCKPQTKNRYIGSIRKLARYLRALEIPAYEPDFVRVRSNFTAYTFTDEQFKEIIITADNFIETRRGISETSYVFPVLLRLLYGCGLRIGEALALKWMDIDLKSKVILIRQAKNYKERFVPMSDSMSDILKAYKKRQFADDANDDLLFESHCTKGQPYLSGSFRAWFLKVLERTSIPNQRSEPYENLISPHTFRHYFTFKSFLQADSNGIPLSDFSPRLSAYLGHETLLETERYLATDYTLYKKSHKNMNDSIGILFPEVHFE